MRARLMLPVFIALVGCSMDNPAFGGAGGTASETGLATDSASTDPTTNTTDQTTAAPQCQLGPGQPLKIEVLASTCLGDDPENFEAYYELYAASGDTLSVYSCTGLDCSSCLNGQGDLPGPLTFTPLALDGIAEPGTCLHVVARRSNPTNPAGCSFQTVIVEALSNGTRVPLLIGRNFADVGLPPIDANSPLAGFDPIPKPDQTCDCDIYTDDCPCGVPPTVYAYDVGLMGLTDPVKLGDVGTIVLPVGTYDFKPLNGYQSGECNDPTQIAWALVRQSD